MTSQGTPSTEVLSLISDVTEPDEISDDVNAYFQKLISPETGKTTYKCLFCEKTWETIVSTARKGHLANHQLAKLYSTTLCPMVPKTVSLHFIEMLNVLQQVRRVVDVVWSTTSRPAKYQVVTQFIEMLNADDLINAEQENVNYLINVELHQCVKAARDIPNKPYNFEVELISEEEDQSD